MDDKIIWYKTFYNPSEANIAQTRLADCGFQCFLRDENISILQPMHNQAVGGVKLMVFENDVPLIESLLAEDQSLTGDSVELDSSDKAISARKCERCGSNNVGFGQATNHRYSWWITIISFIFTVLPFRANKCYHCYNCGHEFLE